MKRALFSLMVVLTVMSSCSPSSDEATVTATITTTTVSVTAKVPKDGATNPNCFKRSSDAIGGPIELTSHDGRTVTEKDFAGRKALVFFGYTYCPDICPITLYNVGKALQDMPVDKRPATIFVSVDPSRDTPEILTQYIQSNGFPEDIVGLTGTEAQLTAATQAFKTTFGRGDESESAGGYLVSHSSILYLMDENWKLQTFFMQDESAADIASCLAAL